MSPWKISNNEGCECEKTFFLGSDLGNNKYYKCVNCGGIIIYEGERSEKKIRKEMIKEEKRNRILLLNNY